MTRIAKVHRGYRRIGTWGDRTARAGQPIVEPVCGIISRTPVLTAGEFQWLPRERQCELCLSSFFPVQDAACLPGCMPGVKSATPEMIVVVETFCLSFARLALDLANLHASGWRHRCWFDAERRVCACGFPSLTDPAYAERMIGVALGPTVDGYDLRHVCRSCAIGFRSKDPRGTSPSCGWCRGLALDICERLEQMAEALP